MEYQGIISTYLNGNLTDAAAALEEGGAALTARVLVYGVGEGLLQPHDAQALTHLLNRRADEAARARVADSGFETDSLPADICENCLGENTVRFDAQSGRRLCIECEPNPLPE